MLNTNHKLYRIAIKSKWSRSTKKTMYFIAESKEECMSYITSQLNHPFYIDKVYFLGDALSGRLFKKP